MSAGTNTLVSGPNRLTNQSLAGLTVAQIRERFGSVLNIPAGANVTVNGHSVPDTQTIVNGEEIIFSKALGAKG